MSKNAHTKGPWTIREDEDILNQVLITAGKDDNNWETLAIVYGLNRQKGMRFPNAPLIAAAPDLLAACEIVQTNLRDLTEDIHLRAAFQAVSEAIRIAKGGMRCK